MLLSAARGFIDSPSEMETSISTLARQAIPESLKAHLQRLGSLRSAGLLNEPSFKFAIETLTQLEFQPRGLELQVRDLSDGRTRFLLRQPGDRRVCELIDCAA
jgi:hypothetical protein